MRSKKDYFSFKGVARFEEFITFRAQGVPNIQSECGVVIDDENAMVIHGESSFS